MPVLRRNAGEQILIHRHERSAVCAERVERAALDEALERAFVQLRPAHALQKVGKAFKRPVRFPFLRNVEEQLVADVFDRLEAKADFPVLDGKAIVAFVHVRRKKPNPPRRTVCDILDRFGGIAHHGAEQRGHIFRRVKPLQVRGLVCDDGVGRRVRLVERIAGKVHDLVKDARRHALAHAARNRAVKNNVAILVFLAVDKELALLFHHVVLLFAHGAP